MLMLSNYCCSVTARQWWSQNYSRGKDQKTIILKNLKNINRYYVYR